jgi:hypothetical protein
MPIINKGRQFIELSSPITKNDLKEILLIYHPGDKIRIDGQQLDIGAFVRRYVTDDNPEYVIKFLAMMNIYQSYICEQTWAIVTP